MKKIDWQRETRFVLFTLLGSALFALAFDLFLDCNDLNSGGMSGLAMVFVQLTGVGTVGTLTALMNLPLFIIGGLRVGKRFFVGSFLGLVTSSFLIDAFAVLPPLATDPLLGALYGGICGGLGLGLVFVVGSSTGGSDIVIRLLKMRLRNLPLGTISIIFDAFVAVLTGIAFRDPTKALYTGIATFATGQVIDAVVYRFDYSKVAYIISPQYEKIAAAIDSRLLRGVTYLYGQGFYSGKDTKVILTAVKRQQLAELKELVVGIDPNAFIIVQETHQVLGDGFTRYNKNAL